MKLVKNINGATSSKFESSYLYTQLPEFRSGVCFTTLRDELYWGNLVFILEAYDSYFKMRGMLKWLC